MKSFCSHRCPSKDYVIIVTYAPNCNVHMLYAYNSISGGYMGTMIESFTESVRGLLRVVPNFFEDMDGFRPEDSLKAMGFEQTEMNDNAKELYNKLHQ